MERERRVLLKCIVVVIIDVGYTTKEQVTGKKIDKEGLHGFISSPSFFYGMKLSILLGNCFTIQLLGKPCS